MKVFARIKNINDEYAGVIPLNQNISNAIHGFLSCGIEIHYYSNVNDIYELYEKGDIVLDGIYQVNHCLSKFNIIPNSIDYPKVLMPYLGRKIWKDTINNINNNPNLWGNFVKPTKDKVFVGKIINSPADLIGCGSCYENFEVVVSEPVEFIYECRGFVYYDELIDLRPYKGDWTNMSKMDTNVIKAAMKDFATWSERPCACSLDFGVTRDGRTLLVEQNLPYALGCYGLNTIDYAKMISAYISDISGVEDELNFERKTMKGRN